MTRAEESLPSDSRRPSPSVPEDDRCRTLSRLASFDTWIAAS
jgi:hypothetical protein